jgi:Ni,Fe-hydrogenase I large subunit
MTFYNASHLDAQEFTKWSMYREANLSKGRHMWKGKTAVDPDKANAYTYAKSPRYKWAPGEIQGAASGDDDYWPYEVGPLSRLMANASILGTNPSATAGQVVAVNNGQASLYYPGILADVDTVIAANAGALGLGVGLGGLPIGVLPAWGTNLSTHLTGLVGAGLYYLPAGAIHANALSGSFPWDYYGSATLDRIACRTLETYYVGAQMLNWFNAIDAGVNSSKTLHYGWGQGWKQKVPKYGAKGAGLTEAPRGALGHWVTIGARRKTDPKYSFNAYKGKVSNYQIITPTTWNINPKDHNDRPGPAEFCMMDTFVVNDAEPIEVLRVIHSFDFCCACTVHVMNAKKEKVAEVTLEALP